MATAARQRPGVFRVNENAALALERAWADGGYHGFSVDDGAWSAITSARQVLTGDTPGLARKKEDPGALAGDAVMSDVPALVPASAEMRTCRVCGLADPPPDLTCLFGQDLVDHRVGTVAGCPRCGRLREACARRPCFGSMREATRTKVHLVVRLSRLARRLVTRPAADRADQ
jgi:hypothetical protein